MTDTKDLSGARIAELRLEAKDEALAADMDDVAIGLQELLALLAMAERSVTVATMNELRTLLAAAERDDAETAQIAGSAFGAMAIADLHAAATDLIDQEGKANEKA
jgi:hypothetical protein